MAAVRAKRLPISCEPCRIRKIRCPRDGTPCGTCVRRGISPHQCQYAKRQQHGRGDKNGHEPLDPEAARGDLLSPRSTAVSSTNTAASVNSDLALRVQKLEQQLQAQAEAQQRLLARPDPSTQNPAFDSFSQSPDQSSSVQDQQRQQQENLVRNLHGSLITTETGHVRFVPSSMQLDSSSDALTDQEQHGGVIATPSGPFPLGESGKLSATHFVSLLPPRSHCTELVETYFSSFASLFHILHDPTFRDQYASFMDDPESMPLSWIALLFTVIGTAVYAVAPDSTILDDLSRRRDTRNKINELAERYRSLALRALEADHYLWNHNVTTLQTLILLIHSISHSHGQTWTLLGLTYNLAISIGCHVDPEIFGLPAIECEERRRCWSGLMMLYTSQNTVLGHVGIPKAQFPSTSRPPADLDDEDLIPGQHETPPSSDRATQMSYLLLKFRLYEISSDVCNLVTSTSEPQFATIRDLDDAIMREQTSWEARYRRHSQVTPLPIYHRAHLNVLYSYASHITLILHHRTALQGPPSPGQEWSRRRIISSAKRLLGVHAALFESPDFAPFAWYNQGLGSFHALHACALIIALLNSDEARAEFDALKKLLQQCLARFEAMQDTSHICTKGAPVLRRMMSQSSAEPYPSPQSFQQTQAGGPDLAGDQGRVVHDINDTTMQGQNFDPSIFVQGNPGEMNVMMDQLAVQHWLSPVTLPWDMWDQ